jgi:hypothetical protein
MDDDFPAAHSMDTEWYAVDSQGHVAVFDSSENGHAPLGITDGDAFYELAEVWYSARDYSRPHPLLGLSKPEMAARLGLFYYEYTDEFDPIAPYRRAASPTSPVHIDQLPPRVRHECSRLWLVETCFADARLLQPLEHWECDFWYKESRYAYLSSDGITVRPLPEMVPEFAAFVERFRKEDAGRAAHLRFEGVKDADGR